MKFRKKEQIPKNC